MAKTRVQKLLDRLKEWCSQEWGRQTLVAKALGVTPQFVSNWFNGVSRPTGEQVLAIQEFLKKHRVRSLDG